MLDGILGPDEPVATMAMAMRGRRRDLAVATDARLVLLWRGRALPWRSHVEEHAWSGLSDVRTHPMSLELVFEDGDVVLSGGKPAEADGRLLEALAPSSAVGPRRCGAPRARPPKARPRARLRLLQQVRVLPDRLEPGEEVQRLAVARGGFEGLLVVTDRRLLLLRTGFRASAEQAMSRAREDVRGAEATETGLVVHGPDGPLALAEILRRSGATSARGAGPWLWERRPRAPLDRRVVAQQHGRLRREHAAVAVRDGDVRVGDLALAALAAQLAHRLDEREQAVHARVAVRQAAAVGVQRGVAARRDAPAGDERAALALRAEAEVLEEEDRA